MKRTFCMLFVASIITLGLAGCNNAGQPSSAQSTAPLSPVQSATPSEFVESTLENFHIALATDELLSKHNLFHEYINNEDGASLIIWADTVIKDFAFITVDYDDTGDKLSFIAGETLFSIDELSPEKPFVVKLLIPGSIPAYGISFMGENGIERYYTINLSGRGADEAPPYYLLEFESSSNK